MKENRYSTKDLVTMAILIAISGPFQVLWAQFTYGLQGLGPFKPLFSNAGFMVWAYLAVWLVPKAGAATIVKGVGAVIEVLLGNPVGPVAIAYGALEGVAVDLGFWAFRRRITVEMMIVSALISQAITGPIDFFRDRVPFNFLAMAAYWTPGAVGTITTGYISSLVLRLLQRAGLRGQVAVSS